MVDSMSSAINPRILILGAGGMLGNTLFRYFSAVKDFSTIGTLRSEGKRKFFSETDQKNLISPVNMESDNDLLSLFSATKPTIVINCVGIIKQRNDAHNHLASIAINSMLPHRLHRYCCQNQARLIHFSTDCVFLGQKGHYTESDFPDSNDLYGRSKFLGELNGHNAVTLRTSMIGHELESSLSLVDWFLTQDGSVKGFRKSIFSGLPTFEIARVVHRFVIPNPQLEGLYHLSVDPISKFDLLNLVAQLYRKDITIMPDDEVAIDRSLNSEKFRFETGFSPRPWPELIAGMYQDYRSFNSGVKK